MTISTIEMHMQIYEQPFGDDSAKYFQHFLQNGMAEGRQACGDFDVKIYKNNYNDLAGSIW